MLPTEILILFLDKNGNINLLTRLFVFFITAFLFAAFIGFNYTDDGIRHLVYGYELIGKRTWGDIYPYSLFSDFDPWSFWHILIHAISSFTDIEHAPFYINFISIFILLNLVYLLLTVVFDEEFKDILFVVAITITYLSIARYINGRPDLLSGFYILTILYLFFKTNKERTAFFLLLLFILSVAYSFTYYLFFVYVACFVGYFLLIRKYKAVAVLLLSMVISFALKYYLYGYEYFQTIFYVLNDYTLRGGLSVSEGLPTIDVLNVFGLKGILLIYLIFYIYFFIKKRNFFVNNELLAFVFVSSLLWIGQVRYYELFKPILLIAFIYYFKNLILIYQRECRYIRLVVVFFKKYAIKANKNKSFMIYFILFIAFELSITLGNSLKADVIDKFLKTHSFDNKTVLISTLDRINYKLLYYSPYARIIPSCSIGWFNTQDQELKKKYIKLIQKELETKDIFLFAKNVGADYVFLNTPLKEQIDIKNIKSYKLLYLFDKYLIFVKRIDKKRYK